MDPVDAAAAAFGDQLRSVIVYGVDEAAAEVTADVRYLRDDVRAEVGDVDDLAGKLARDYHFESVERPYHEQIRRLGELRASVRMFEQAAVVRSLAGEDGVSVSVDPGALPALGDYLDRLAD